MPLMLFVVEENKELIVCVSAVTQEGENSIGLTEVMTDALIEQGRYRSFDFQPPTLAMGTYHSKSLECEWALKGRSRKLSISLITSQNRFSHNIVR